MDETTINEAEEQAQEETEQPTETDWQAKYEAMRKHSREWEKQAKANKAAAEELDALKAEQMSETEKLNARAEAAEKQLAALKAENERRAIIAETAKSANVPAELLEFCTDNEKIGEFAELLAKSMTAQQQTVTVPPAAYSAGARIVSSGGKRSNGDVFEEFASKFLKG